MTRGTLFLKLMGTLLVWMEFLGLILGAAYATATLYLPILRTPQESGGSLLVGLYISIVFCAPLGLLFGGICGLLLGILDGATFAALTVWKFYPLKNPISYKRTMVIVIAGITIMMAAPIFFSRDLLGALLAFPIVPTLLAAGSAGYASYRTANWYISAAQKAAVNDLDAAVSPRFDGLLP